MAPGALWAAAFALMVVQQGAAATFTAPCGSIAKWDGSAIDGCIECMANGTCQLCHHTRLTKWSSTGAIVAVSGTGAAYLSWGGKLPFTVGCGVCKHSGVVIVLWKVLRSGNDTVDEQNRWSFTFSPELRRLRRSGPAALRRSLHSAPISARLVQQHEPAWSRILCCFCPCPDAPAVPSSNRGRNRCRRHGGPELPEGRRRLVHGLQAGHRL